MLEKFSCQLAEYKKFYAKNVEKNRISSYTLRQLLHLRMIIMYLIKKLLGVHKDQGGEKAWENGVQSLHRCDICSESVNGSGGTCNAESAFSYRADFKHLLKGAFVGALWACILAAFPGIPIIVQMFGTYVAAGMVMAAVAYGIKSRRELFRAIGGIYLISVVLGGVMVAIMESSPARELAKWLPESFLHVCFWLPEASASVCGFSRFCVFGASERQKAGI